MCGIHSHNCNDIKSLSDAYIDEFEPHLRTISSDDEEKTFEDTTTNLAQAEDVDDEDIDNDYGDDSAE